MQKEPTKVNLTGGKASGNASKGKGRGGGRKSAKKEEPVAEPAPVEGVEVADAPAPTNITGAKTQRRQTAAQKKKAKKDSGQTELPTGEATEAKEEKTKPKPQIRSETLSKLQNFLCSKDGGGDLTEEQHIAQQTAAVKKLEDKDPNDNTYDSHQDKSTSHEDSQDLKKEKGSQNKRVNFAIGKALEEKLIVMDAKASLKEKQKTTKLNKKESLLMQEKPYWLTDEKRLDEKQRPITDDNYDPSTIHIPPEEFLDLSDGMKRYWGIKKDNMDKILIYRFGDWYVTYYDDTSICSKIFDLVITPHPGKAQVGFEVRHLEKYIGMLTERGHKVAVCEQTETMEMMNARLKEEMEEKKKKIQQEKDDKRKAKVVIRRKITADEIGTIPENKMNDISSQPINSQEEKDILEKKAAIKKEKEKKEEQKIYDTTDTKAVNRTITHVYSRGTYNPAQIDDKRKSAGWNKGQKYEDTDGMDESTQQRLIQENEYAKKDQFDDRYILVYTRQGDKVGFVFFDISILHFYVGYFDDPKTNVANFRTLVQSLKPVEVVTLFSENHKDLIKMLKRMSNRPILSYMTQDKLPDVAKADEMSKAYASQNAAKDMLYPDGLEAMFSEFMEDQQVSLVAVGLTMKYMEDMMLAEQTIPFASFRPYHGDSTDAFLNVKTNMVLDFATQESLEIFGIQVEDEDDKSMEIKSLVDLVDQTSTPFGRRLLRKWLTAPLTDVDQIRSRQDAVGDLLFDFNLVKSFRNHFAKMGDVERLLARVYSYSIKSQQQIVYEEYIWNFRLTEFRKSLQMLDQMLDLKVSLFEHCKGEFKSDRLRCITTFKNVAEPPEDDPEDESENVDMRFQLEESYGSFHNYTPILKPFQACIEWEKVENDRYMPRPQKGMDDEIDEILEKMDAIKLLLKDFLSRCRQKFNCDKITFASNRKYRFQLELPHEFCTPIDEDDDFFVTARLKHCRRYLSSELTNLTTQLCSEEIVYKARISPLIRDMFERFYQNREHWQSAVKCMAEVDALCALAEASNEPNMVRPVVHATCEKPFINIQQMRHPLIERKTNTTHFVPNNLIMNYDDSRTLLITGPNMGGKSTMLRTSCLIIIMAQIGCNVPADSADFSVVDQIFTRVGANDKILENKSTFYLELEETKYIIDRATKNSMIIMDELGRGTSTFDGYSLAQAILKYLLNTNQSRLLFTTHYHWLVDDFRSFSGIQLYTMKIDDNVENNVEEEMDVDEGEDQPFKKKIRFLYQFEPGVTLSSFGVHVAEIAGINKSIILKADQIANSFNKCIHAIKESRKIKAN